jgi:hypothetical protein
MGRVHPGPEYVCLSTVIAHPPRSFSCAKRKIDLPLFFFCENSLPSQSFAIAADTVVIVTTIRYASAVLEH